MSKKILIGIESLNSGGVEVSLIRFLNELSKYNDIEIDLLLLKKEGIYLEKVPKNINIIEITNNNPMYKYTNDIRYLNQLNGINKIKYLFFESKVYFYKKINRYDLYYKLLLKNIKEIDGYYDLAIDYLGYGHFLTSIIAAKVQSRKKAMWIHDEKNSWINQVKKYIDKFDKIFCVGESCKNNIIKEHPELRGKLDIFYNMTDYKNIIEKSKEKTDISFDSNVTNIVTVGRLEWQKAYDVAIEIAEELKKRHFKFCWYAIGGGTKEVELKTMVKEKKLEKEFKFLGVVKNPFPIVKKADLFVLSSRHEGYCLATLEAKILNSVIIATDIDSNREQIVNGENGFLCKLDPKDFADKIIEVSNNKQLIKKVKNNLSKENFDYTSEFTKLFKMLDGDE